MSPSRYGNHFVYPLLDWKIPIRGVWTFFGVFSLYCIYSITLFVIFKLKRFLHRSLNVVWSPHCVGLIWSREKIKSRFNKRNPSSPSSLSSMAVALFWWLFFICQIFAIIKYFIYQLLFLSLQVYLTLINTCNYNLNVIDFILYCILVFSP